MGIAYLKILARNTLILRIDLFTTNTLLKQYFFFLYKAFYYAFAYSFEIFKDEGDN